MLVQPNKDKHSRTYFDFNTLSQAMSGKAPSHAVLASRRPFAALTVLPNIPLRSFCASGLTLIFENKLRELNPGSQSLTYELPELFKYIDSLADVSILVYDKEHKMYKPYGITVIKNHLLQQIMRNQKQ